MRLERLSVKGLTRYDEASVDFAALGEGLIAIAGKNGEGKTSILEAPFAAWHLEMPSRPGNLANVMHGKDARLELTFRNGAPYRALVAVDAIGKSSEAYLYNGDGSPVTSGKVREYTAETEKRFGSPRLFLAACLSAQTKAGGFLNLSKSERKELLSEILDTGNLQAMSETARERAKAAEKKLDALRGELSALRSELDGMPAVDREALDKESKDIRRLIEEGEVDLEAARKAYADAKANLAVAEEQAKGRAAKEEELSQARKDLQDTQTRFLALQGEQTRLKARIEASTKEQRAEAARLEEYTRHADQAEYLAGRVTLLRADEARLTQEIESAREEYRQAEDVCRQADRIRNQIQAAKVQSALLGEVTCKGEGVYAGCKLLAVARTAGDSLPELEAQLSLLEPLPNLEEKRGTGAILEGGLRETRDALKKTEGELETERTLANRLPLAKAADARIAELERELIEGEETITRRRGEHNQHLCSIQQRIDRLAQEVEQTRAQGNLGAMKDELNAIAERGRTLKDQVAGLQAEAQRLSGEIARAEQVEGRRKELGVTLELKAGTESDLVKDLNEWAVLERALGRDGIQALEIDAAGPGLSDLTNELLRSCFGERFEVRFVTQVPRADGKGSKEVFDVQVIDHDRGREGSVDTLSGGEKTIVSEAISLALAIYVGRHSERRFETLFRDETAGQLDPDNAARYISMLRRARQIGAFRQVIYIAQQPEVWQAADAVLWCEGGKVEVRNG